jgi:hypothetical protein
MFPCPLPSCRERPAALLRGAEPPGGRAFNPRSACGKDPFQIVEALLGRIYLETCSNWAMNGRSVLLVW